MAPAMERAGLPECPVCLQFYDGEATIPRVLPCGHSACGDCLAQLPQPFPQTVRCPACTQLVKCPHPQGPSGLPKNIDLLRLCSFFTKEPSLSQADGKPQRPIEKSPPNSDPPQFMPTPWSHEFYCEWKDWIIPSDSISIESSNNNDVYFSVLSGRAVKSLNSFGMLTRCSLKENDCVGLVQVGSYSCGTDDSKFSYSYLARVMMVLYGMKDGKRDELGLILKMSLKQSRICKFNGLWYDSNGSLYIVCKRIGENSLNKFRHLIDGSVEDKELGIGKSMSIFALVGMELCEVASVLHSEGLVCGFLALSCFSVDLFGHLHLDLGEVLTMGRRVHKMIAESGLVRQTNNDDKLDNNSKNNLSETVSAVCPELLLAFFQKNCVRLGSKISIHAMGHGSDAWSLACLFLQLLIGEPFNKELREYFHHVILLAREEKFSDIFDMHVGWMDKVKALLETRLGKEFLSRMGILCECLNFSPSSRPTLTDLWMNIRKLFVESKFDIVIRTVQADSDAPTSRCLALETLCQLPTEIAKLEGQMVVLPVDDENGEDNESEVDRDVVEGLSRGHVNCTELKGHRDCITALAVGGGFLFSSSYDKTVQVWSLQEVTCVHSFIGHQQRIMGLAYVEDPPLCISGDNGGEIFIWDINVPFSEEPLKKLNEKKDWRYSGIHALAVSGTGYFYTGGGDKSIKAWSLKDYTLSCSMHGHRSVVSALAACNGVLYSGSWDGTVRLWALSDHSPLTVLGEDIRGNVSSIFSIAADQHVLLSAHENGCIKIWRNDMFVKSAQAHKGAIFSVSVERKWLFTGGLDKIISVQELPENENQIDAVYVGSIACDSVITVLLYKQGKLFVGQADSIIKVFQYSL